MKKCKKCKKLKKLTEYRRNKNSDDGLNLHCSVCMDRYKRNKNIINKPDYYKENKICEGKNYKDYIKQDKEMSKYEKRFILSSYKIIK